MTWAAPTPSRLEYRPPTRQVETRPVGRYRLDSPGPCQATPCDRTLGLVSNDIEPASHTTLSPVGNAVSDFPCVKLGCFDNIWRLCPTLSGSMNQGNIVTQGVALGYVVPVLRTEESGQFSSARRAGIT